VYLLKNTCKLCKLHVLQAPPIGKIDIVCTLCSVASTCSREAARALRLLRLERLCLLCVAHVATCAAHTRFYGHQGAGDVEHGPPWPAESLCAINYIKPHQTASNRTRPAVKGL
jgi:hypothetical protein